MPLLSLRPTFDIELNESRQSVIEKLKLHKKQSGLHELYQLYGEYGEIHLPKSEHRLWSPYLTFYIADATRLPEGSVLHGRFTPRLDVWTSVWIFYLLMAFSAFFGLTIGYSQWYVGEPPWGVGITIFGILCIATLHVIASVGQQWSADQMTSLRQHLESLIESSGIESSAISTSGKRVAN
jgi:hypothetical protein